MEHGWGAYTSYAWGADELDPLLAEATHTWRMGLTLVDSLDTLHMMGLVKEFDEAVAWVGRNLRFEEQEEVNVFEVTIRVLAGLLSAHELSGSRPLDSGMLHCRVCGGSQANRHRTRTHSQTRQQHTRTHSTTSDVLIRRRRWCDDGAYHLARPGWVGRADRYSAHLPSISSQSDPSPTHLWVHVGSRVLLGMHGSYRRWCV